MTHRVEPGQEYETCRPIYYLSNGPEPTRIRILSTTGFGRVTIVTLTDDGRELRQRLINARQLHPTGTTTAGQPRTTGYRLVRNADGSAA